MDNDGWKTLDRRSEETDLEGGVDVGADGRATGLQHVGGAQRGGRERSPPLQPLILPQGRELQSLLGVHSQQTWKAAGGE